MKLTGLIINLVIAAATAWAAVAAWRSASQARTAADNARKAAQGQLLAGLLDAYAAPEMQTAILLIKSWQPEDRINPGSDLDQARRRVSHFFQKVAHFLEGGLIDETVARIAAPADAVAIHCQRVEPMEKLVNSAYDASSFEALARLHGGRNCLPWLPDRSSATPGGGGTA